MAYGRDRSFNIRNQPQLNLRVVIRRNSQLLPRLDPVRVRELIAVGVKDAHVFISAPVKQHADLRKRVAGLNSIGLTSSRSASHGRGSWLFDGDVCRDVTGVRINQLDLIPDLVLGLISRRG